MSEPTHKIDTDVPLPERNPWRKLAEDAKPGHSIGGLTKLEASRFANALREAGHGASMGDDPVAEGKTRVWCVEKTRRAKPKPRAGKPGTQEAS